MNNKIFYHITLLDNLDSILEKGLIPNIGPQCLRCKNDNSIEKLVYLTDLRSVQKWKKSLFPNCRSCVILQVNCNNFSLIKRKKFIEGIEIGCREVISLKNIKVMCLICKQVNPLIADKDIVVYKLIKFRNGFMYAPFKKCLLREYPTNNNNACNYIDPDTFERYSVITDGFIHANTAKCRTFTTKYIFIEGIIPEGTEYYINRSNKVIAARYIKFNVPWYQRLAMNIRDLYEKIFN